MTDETEVNALRAENERLREHAELASLVLHGFKEAAELAQAKLEEAAKVLEPFVNVRDQHPESVKLINGKLDGFTLMSVNVTKDQFIAAHAFLSNLKGAE